MERFQLRLITEGKTDRTLLETLLDHKQRHIDIPRLPPKDVKDAGGYSWLTKRGNLDAFLNAGDAERFGIIVDADTNPIARWESLRNRLVEFAFDADQLPGILPADGLVATFPKRRPVGVWLMPGNGSPGNVEDFFTSLIRPSDALLSQARKCVGAMPAALMPESGRAKATYRTWLAWQDGGDGMSPRTAFEAKLYDPAKAESFRNWIQRLLDTPA